MMKKRSLKECKILFLDIDGVLQPCGSQIRFEHCHREIEKGDMPMLYANLERKLGIDYSIYNQYDVAAVFYDWDKTAVALLRFLLKITSAKIVLSSDWRLKGMQTMIDFLTIYQLEEFFIDVTKEYNKIDKNFVEELITKIKNEKEIDLSYSYRSIEILEWLHRNPDVTHWVALDDRKLYGIEENFVYMSESSFNDMDGEKAYRILMK